MNGHMIFFVYMYRQFFIVYLEVTIIGDALPDNDSWNSNSMASCKCQADHVTSRDEQDGLVSCGPGLSLDFDGFNLILQQVYAYFISLWAIAILKTP